MTSFSGRDCHAWCAQPRGRVRCVGIRAAATSMIRRIIRGCASSGVCDPVSLQKSAASSSPHARKRLAAASQQRSSSSDISSGGCPAPKSFQQRTTSWCSRLSAAILASLRALRPARRARNSPFSLSVRNLYARLPHDRATNATFRLEQSRNIAQASSRGWQRRVCQEA